MPAELDSVHRQKLQFRSTREVLCYEAGMRVVIVTFQFSEALRTTPRLFGSGICHRSALINADFAR